MEPPAAFRVAARRPQLRRPRPGAVGDLDPDNAVPGMTATVTVSPGAPEPLCRILLPKISLTSKTATSPQGCPGPSTSETNARAARARSARPASVTVSRTAAPAITAPAFPAAPPREIGRAAGGHRECTLDSAANVKPHTGLRGPPWTVRAAAPVRGPSVAAPVRGRPCKADAPRTAPWPRFPSAMRPWTPQHDGLQRYKVTHAGTEKKRPASTRIRS